MRILIQKLPTIEGDVLLIDTEGNEHPVYDYFQELEAARGNFAELLLIGYEMMFVPEGPQNLFMEGGQYSLVELNGNDLMIVNEKGIGNGENPKWIAVD